jgi:hypothetical protein
LCFLKIARAIGSYKDEEALQRDFGNIVRFRSSEVIGISLIFLKNLSPNMFLN